MSSDPRIREGVPNHAYNYADNNPVVLTDPDGRDASDNRTKANEARTQAKLNRGPSNEIETIKGIGDFLIESAKGIKNAISDISDRLLQPNAPYDLPVIDYGVAGVIGTAESVIEAPKNLNNFKNLTPREKGKAFTSTATSLGGISGIAKKFFGKKGGAKKDSVKIPGRVKTRINIRLGDADKKSSGLLNALKKHGGEGPGGKSQFSISKEEITSILQKKDTIRANVRASGDSGNFIREVDVGKNIGNLPINKGGKPTSFITVITDKQGNLINTFPGKLGRKR